MGLERFVDAQDGDGSYERAVAELRDGAKVTHWMWWVFPQLAGLGSSPTARRYAVADLDEARRYVADPVLGPRLARAAAAALSGGARRGWGPTEVLGGIDALKLRSSMTLFEVANPGAGPWAEVLDTWYEGGRDAATLRLLGPVAGG